MELRGSHGDPMMMACRICGLVHTVEPLESGTAAKCRRCGSTIVKRTPYSLPLTAALSFSALILYVPANIFPILRLEMYGVVTENTVWQGSKRLFQDGDYAIAVIVFLASMLIPLLKLLGLIYLVAATKFNLSRGKLVRTWVFRAIDSIGRWAMLDVFVMAILVSLVKLQKLATIIAGKGLFAFSCVVVLTLFASACFDPQMIWERERAEP
jgi:paraquat-inducible protein A